MLGLLSYSVQAEPLSCRAGTKPFARTELFFGAGGASHAPAWKRFLARVVTPRFPDGFTVVDGAGQWRAPKGIIGREASHVLIVVYPPGLGQDRPLEEIRDAYKRQFKQQSVLRVDSEVCAGF